jgi:hypothetical protein
MSKKEANMKVIAAPGTRCPKEGKPREYITDSEAVDVPDTAYYRRLVRDGSLRQEQDSRVQGSRGTPLSPRESSNPKKGVTDGK